jgi:hypothetical protein
MNEGLPAEDVVNISTLSTADLLEFLPTEKVMKPRGSDVQIARSPFETAVIEELWDRHCKDLLKGLKAAVFAPGSTLCPQQEPDRLLFVDEVLTRVRDALFRLTVRGSLTARGAYGDFGDYLWAVTRNKALDLRKELSGERPVKRKQAAGSSPDSSVSPQEQATRGKPIAVPLDVLEDVATAPGFSVNPIVMDVRNILEAYRDESPERAASLEALVKKELDGWTWEELAARLPSEQSNETKIQKARRFNEKDIAQLRVRLKALL